MGLLHDIGKIGVPNEIINKPKKLTDSEYKVIKTHPAIGYDILAEIKTRPELAKGAHWHHERYDGKGYPDGLSGKDIPLEARIIAVADSYDAMTSNRSYRDYLPQDVVRSELEKNKNTQFDPDIVDVMISIIDEDKDYSLHEMSAAEPEKK
jgi:putative two-component system response regulator